MRVERHTEDYTANPDNLESNGVSGIVLVRGQIGSLCGRNASDLRLASHPCCQDVAGQTRLGHATN